MSTFKVGDTTIEYQVFGEGTPILFIHGWGMDHRIMSGSFENVFNNLKYKRIYIDLPGMGKSIAGNINNTDKMLNVIHNFVSEVINEKFIIVGESYGGYISRGYANKYSDELKGIILLCPLVYPGYKKGNYEALHVIEKDDEFLACLSKGEYDSFTYMNVILTKEVFDKYKRDIMPAIDEQNSYFLSEVLDGSFSFDVDDMEPFMKPCLIIVGKQDTEVGYKDQFGLINKYPCATYCAVEGAGHNLQIEKPDIFSSIVKKWVLMSKFWFIVKWIRKIKRFWAFFVINIKTPTVQYSVLYLCSSLFTYISSITD